jgi:hypothetical protein
VPPQVQVKGKHRTNNRKSRPATDNLPPDKNSLQSQTFSAVTNTLYSYNLCSQCLVLFLVSHKHPLQSESEVTNTLCSHKHPPQSQAPSAVTNTLCNHKHPLQSQTPSAVKNTLCSHKPPLQSQTPSAVKNTLCSHKHPLQSQTPSAVTNTLCSHKHSLQSESQEANTLRSHKHPLQSQTLSAVTNTLCSHKHPLLPASQEANTLCSQSPLLFLVACIPLPYTLQGAGQGWTTHRQQPQRRSARPAPESAPEVSEGHAQVVWVAQWGVGCMVVLSQENTHGSRGF